MRPIKLTIQGLNSFTDEQTIDFGQVGEDNIFCISGVTGSGKTTILDAIILSLYKNMKYRGNLDDYINLRYPSAKIAFEFELGGEIYSTERVISRKGKNTFVLRRNDEPISEGDDAFELLKEKIGLDASEFTNVVVLQQGEFAKFLKQTKSERVKLVNKLFSLDRFDGLASKFRAKAEKSRGAMEACEKSLLNFEGITAERIQADGERVAVLTEELENKRKLEKRANEEKEKIIRAYEEFTKQQKLEKEIKDGEAKLAVLLKREQTGAELTASLIEEEKALIEREKGRDELVKKKTVLLLTKDELSKLEDKEARASKNRSELEKMLVKAHKARADYEKANAEKVENDIVLERLRTENAVAAIHAKLSDGDECPVCGGVYRQSSINSDDDISKKLSETVKKSEELAKRTEEAKNAATNIEASFAAENKALLELEEEIRAEKIKLEQKGATSWKEELLKTQNELNKLEADRISLDKRKRDYEQTLNAIKTEIISVSAKLDDKRKQVKAVEEVTEDSVKEKAEEAKKLTEEVTAIAVELATLKERLTRAAFDLEKKKALEKERKENKRDYEKYEAMRALFHANEFSTFVSAEYIKEFTVAASEQLGVLTNGKYSLSYEEESGDFFVSDFLSGNEKRKISTLSGGETFLASLSLAVAISKELSKSKSYDFFFIDEGFGTLSPDALELVVNALTTLSKDCLVGVITHRSELIERLPRTIKVDGANGDKGSTITVV